VAVIVPNGIFLERKVKEALKNQVADFKVPSQFIIVEELPRNSMGKIQKSKLRDAYNEQAS
ncbi:MAG: malonyl-CoA synthase, partial [Actinomycetota bacterium]|nr:malonyl-CoA synthase [Actinomycetota bacterium]